MKAYVTSIGEPTTDLCVWSLERNGFDVVVYKGDSSLVSKLAAIYKDIDEDFVRVDADVVPNRVLTPDAMDNLDPHIWWLQFMVYDWFKQDVSYGGVQFIRRQALPILRQHIAEAQDKERPESYMFRLSEFHNPRRCISSIQVMGLHGFGQSDVERVKATKARRQQSGQYDFELAEKLGALCSE